MKIDNSLISKIEFELFYFLILNSKSATIYDGEMSCHDNKNWCDY